MTAKMMMADSLAPLRALSLSLGMLFAPVGSAAADGSAGAYLAAIQADFENDYVAAARYFTEALSRDKDNVQLLQSIVFTQIAKGSVDLAVPYARRMNALVPGNSLSLLTELVSQVHRDDFAAARALLDDEDTNFNPLIGGLVDGWVAVGEGDIEAAMRKFDATNEDETQKLFASYSKALALAFAGDYTGADEILTGSDGEALRLSRASYFAHAQILAQMEENERAIQVVDEALAGGGNDSALQTLRAKLVAGEPVQFSVVTTAEEGIAEAFETLASVFGRDDGDRFSLLYARLAEYLRPKDHENQLLIAEILEFQEQYSLAVDAYQKVDAASPFFFNAELGRINALVSMEREEVALEALSALARDFADRPTVFSMQGDIFRSQERFEEAAKAYSQAIGLVEEEQSHHWLSYYTRGICYERLGDWDKAEADFTRALELNPNQALVLNYLGYSLVERRERLDQALDMIEKAVELEPENGYIADSLGWVFYRLDRFEDAVAPMEHAASLQPVDPIINDHLGDVYWKVGRKREAVFQWKRALSFDPEDKEARRIRQKLEHGLDVVLEQEAQNPGATQ